MKFGLLKGDRPLRKAFLVAALPTVLLLSVASSGALGQDKSLRQEREEKQAQAIRGSEYYGHCLGYFDINGDAAEVLELKSGIPKQDARAFIQNVDQLRRSLDQFSLVQAISCEGDKACAQANANALELGLREGKRTSQGATPDDVLRKFKGCALALGFARPESFETPTPFELTLLPTSRIQVSAEDIKALQEKIQPCFKLPPNVKREPVDLDVYLDGYFRVSSTRYDIHRSDGPSSELWTAVARSVSHPDCQPWNVTALNYRGGAFVLSLRFVPMPGPGQAEPATGKPTPKPPEPQPPQVRRQDSVIDSILRHK